jgi:hypothetical protein
VLAPPIWVRFVVGIIYGMAAFLGKWKSSVSGQNRPTACKVSISSSLKQSFTDEAAKFDTPIIAPLDTVQQVCTIIPAFR